MYDYHEEFGPKATMAEAHAEWHRNAGVPMGQPGCPQDACDPPEDEGDYEPASVWMRDYDHDPTEEEGR